MDSILIAITFFFSGGALGIKMVSTKHEQTNKVIKILDKMESHLDGIRTKIPYDLPSVTNTLNQIPEKLENLDKTVRFINEVDTFKTNKLQELKKQEEVLKIELNNVKTQLDNLPN